MARWQDLFEQADRLDSRQFAAQKRRRLIGLIAGPALFAAISLAPPPEGVAAIGMPALGIFAWTVTWWVSEAIPIPVTALLSLALLGVFGVVTPDEAFAYWAHWVIIFLIGAFIIGHALTIHGFTRRFAFLLVSHPIVAGSAWRLAVLLLCGAAGLSMVMSNVVVTVVFMAIGEGILEAVKVPRTAKYGSVLFLGIAWAANIGGIGTPVGCPPNLIGIALAQRLGYSIGFLDWMFIGMPLAAAGMIVVLLLLRWTVGNELPDLTESREYTRHELMKMGPMGRGEKIAVATLLVALFLWLLPEFARIAWGPGAPAVVWLDSHLSWPVVSILVASALFVAPVDWSRRQFAMTWNDAVEGIEWGTLALVAGAIAIGTIIGDARIGWGQYVTDHLFDVVPAAGSTYVLVGVFVAATVFLTNFISNNAAVAAFGAFVLAMATSQQFPADPLALLVTIAIASSLGFAFPSANPQCAIVFATGRVRMPMMMKYGAVLGAAMAGVVAGLGYPLAKMVLR